MLTRLAQNSLLAALLFLAPCVVLPAALTHPAPWLAFVFAVTVLVSQPRLDFREPSDRGSAIAIVVAMILAPLVGVLEFVASGAPHAGVAFASGAVVAALGLLLRLWSIRTLGKFFTSAVRVVRGQTVVGSGPYRLLRHPSYTGALLIALGTALGFASAWSVALVLALCVPAYLFRIHVEERELVSRLGAAYEQYRTRTWSLLPGLGGARHAART